MTPDDFAYRLRYSVSVISATFVPSEYICIAEEGYLYPVTISIVDVEFDRHPTIESGVDPWIV
jgi:hypothetical protein